VGARGAAMCWWMSWSVCWVREVQRRSDTSALLVAPVIGAVILLHFSDTAGLMSSRGRRGEARRAGHADLWRLLLVRMRWCAVCAVLGLMPYLYLPWAASRGAETSWGGRDVATIAGFLRHVTRGDYGTFRLAPRGEESGTFFGADHLTRIWLFVSNLARDTAGLGPFLSVWGVYAIFSSPPPLQDPQEAALAEGSTGGRDYVLCRGGVAGRLGRQAVAGGWGWVPGTGMAGRLCGVRGGGLLGVGCVVLVGLGLHLCVFLALANVDITDHTSRYVLSRFSSQAYLSCAFLATAALYRSTSSYLLLRRPRVRLCVLGALLALQVVWIARRWRELDQSSNRLVRQYLSAAFDCIPKVEAGSILLVQGDTPMYVAKYLSEIERLRPDVTILEPDMLTGAWYVRDIVKIHKPCIRFPPGAPGSHSLGDVLRATLSASPGTLVMSLPGDIKNHDASLFFDGPGSFTLVPHGILKRLVYKGLRCWHGFPHTPLTPTPSPPMLPTPPLQAETAQGSSTECLWQHVHSHNLEILRRVRVADTVKDWMPCATVSDRHLSRKAQEGGAGLWRLAPLSAAFNSLPPWASPGQAAPAARAGLHLSGLTAEDCGAGSGSAVGRGVARVERDGWEKAAVANVWSALMSEGFYLMKSANNVLVSTAGAEGKGSGREEVRRERAVAVKALLVALARFEGVLRLFGGRCYNTDLARNLGFYVPIHACVCAYSLCGCTRAIARAGTIETIPVQVRQYQLTIETIPVAWHLVFTSLMLLTLTCAQVSGTLCSAMSWWKRLRKKGANVRAEGGGKEEELVVVVERKQQGGEVGSMMEIPAEASLGSVR
jgi:hypothetical protein